MDFIEDLAVQEENKRVKAELEIQKSFHDQLLKKIEHMKDEILKKKEQLNQLKKELAVARNENKIFSEMIKKSNEEVIEFFGTVKP